MPKIKINISDLSDFEPLPEGIYTVMIESYEERVSQNSGNPYISWTYVVIEPEEYSGRKLWDNTSLSPEARWRLGNLWKACGFESDGSEVDIDTDEMVGCTLKVLVTQAPSRKDPLRNVNEIKRYLRV